MTYSMYYIMQFERGFRVHQTWSNISEDITNRLHIGRKWKDATGNAELTRTDGRNLEVSFLESHISLTVTDGGSYLNFRMFLPRTYAGRTQGFLGNFDGDQNNEFHTRQNTDPIPNINTDQQIFPHLETHCKS